MKKSPGVAALLIAVIAAACLFFTGCAGKGYTPGTAPDSFPCVPESKLEKDIVPEAALENLYSLLFAFPHPNVHFHRVPGAEIGEISDQIDSAVWEVISATVAANDGAIFPGEMPTVQT